MNNEVNPPGAVSPHEHHDPLRKKLREAFLLKDYAINNNLPVSDAIIQNLNAAASEELYPQAARTSDDAERWNKLNYSIRDLTALTYPTTVETLMMTRSRAPLLRSIVIILVGLMAVALIVGVYSYDHVPILSGDGSSKMWSSAVAVTLGALGSLVYISFNLIGVLSEKAFSADDWTSHLIRVVLGAAVGWIFFLAFPAKAGPPILVLLPFLAGFSTRLVVGIITQAIQAVELTLGLDSKNAELQRRRTQAGSRGGRASQP